MAETDDYARALADWQAGEPENAARILKALIRREPGQHAARCLLAQVLLALGQGPAAFAQFQAAIEAAPGQLSYWLAFGLALLRAERFKAAAGVVSEARRRGHAGPELDGLAACVQACQDAPLGLAAPPRLLSGSLAGQHQSVLLAPVRFETSPATLGRLGAVCAQLLGPEAELPPAADLPHSLLAWAIALQRAAGQPIFAPGALLGPELARELALETPGPCLVLPCEDVETARQALRWSLRCHAVLSAAGRPPEAALLSLLAQDTEALLQQLGLRASKAHTTFNLLRAAEAAGIPRQRISPQSFIYRFGYGAASRLLNSTVTDRTPAIGTKLAKDKALSLGLLRQLGLPVPMHRLARDAEAAVAIAAQLGYPVVVKAMNLDLGLGVAAGLTDAEAVRRAFAEVSAHSDYIYVEAQIPGEDHRLLVVGGRLIWARRRIPGGVEGDGRRSVAELLAALNADPRRGPGKHQPLRPLDFDAEARELLAAQGLSLDAVPAAGRRVPLRRIANLSRGGEPVVVTDQVHPENARMAVRAAAALGLDIAGIDFITPDISRPWHEAGGGICEINAQPGIGTFSHQEVYPELLSWLLPGGGRIPIVALGGDSALSEAIGRELHALLCAAGTRAGLANAAGAWIGEEQVSWQNSQGLAGARLLLSDQQAEAAILSLSQADLASDGLPFDRCALAALLPGTPLSALMRELLQVADRLVLPVDIEYPQCPPARILCVASEQAQVQAHLAAGGSAIWSEGEDIRLVMPDRPDALVLSGLAASLEPVALEARLWAMAMAHALGCSPQSPTPNP